MQEIIGHAHIEQGDRDIMCFLVLAAEQTIDLPVNCQLDGIRGRAYVSTVV